ncbi:hypothetical protein VM636_03240 [Streptomyces sp. SCSIO 75703]|uniref:hypothetical protein n=1 Tax=unclassified Streptomyces TaxID=2593676 RepID=UPI0006B677EE|nr:hypothetical protein [Streptomyces sp. TP-A0875]
MAWDEWDELKRDAVQRHTSGMRLDQYPADAGSGPSVNGVTGGVKSTRLAWNTAGEGVGGLTEETGKALKRLRDGQQGLGDASGCLSAGAQKDVYDSWVRYVEAVGERCASVQEVFEQVGHDLLKTDESVEAALAAITLRYADTPAVGGQGAGR